MGEKKAYTQAFQTGKYDKVSGLLGKYDNVRKYWEDQVTGIYLRPFLNNLVEKKRNRLERLRILDLGCGSGDGYDLIMGVTRKDPGIYEYVTATITDDMLKEYVGMDINVDLLRQAEEYYGGNPKMRFVEGDLSHGLPPEIFEGQAPFDFYFTSFGTLFPISMTTSAFGSSQIFAGTHPNMPFLWGTGLAATHTSGRISGIIQSIRSTLSTTAYLTCPPRERKAART